MVLFMRTIRNTTLLFLFLSFYVVLNSQPWMNNSNNFYDIQRSFKSYQKKSTTPILQKNNQVPGWKQFKRWEWYWEQRVFPSGKFPPADVLLVERRKFEKRTKKNRAVLQALKDPSWTNLGPTTSTAGYAGLGRLNVVAVDPNNASNIWVGAASGGLWKSTNAGSSWTTNTDDFASLGVSGIAINPNNSNIMYIATGDGDAASTYSTGVLKSTDGGDTWNSTGLSYSTSSTVRLFKLIINPNDPDILYVVGSIGVYKSTNAGSSWSQMRSGTTYDIEFKTDDPTTLYISTSSSIYKSTDSGSNWTLQASNLPNSGTIRIALAVTAANSNYVYALYANSTNYGLQGVYRTTDGGTTWTEQVGSAADYMGYYSDGSVAGGQGWYDICIAVDPSDEDVVYIGGINLVKSSDGGVNWTTIATWTSSGTYNKNGSNVVHADHHDLYWSPNGSILYNCNDGGLYSTTDDGGTFNWLGDDLEITQFYRIGSSLTSSSKILGGCQDNGTKLYNSSWSDVIGGDGMECHINSESELIMYGAIQNGDIRKSVNGGTSFSSIFTGNGEDAAWVTPYSLDANNQSTLYAGYENVYKSVDDGSNWNSINGTTNIGTIDVLALAPSDANYIYISDGSNARYSSNGGTNWNDITKPGTGSLTRFAVHPSTPTTLWCTLSGYNSGEKVYYSTDAGSNWTNISGSLPNIPVNCIVHEGNSTNRIYVGTDVGVYFRSDDNTSWTSYNEGLPNVVVNDLEVVSSKNKLNAGTYGRGMWQANLASYTSTDNESDEDEDDNDGIAASEEADAPNNGDGNNDGINDAQQANVASFYSSTADQYITVQTDNDNELSNVKTVTIDDESSYAFPYGALQFSTEESQTSIKIYYHGMSSMDGFIYRKKDVNETWFTFTDVIFGTETIDGETVATVTLNLDDGDREDYDGIVNGVIVDPGGPALLVTSNIPVWDEYWFWTAMLLMIGIAYRKYS